MDLIADLDILEKKKKSLDLVGFKNQIIQTVAWSLY
jgi:hypothetical protein